MRLLIKLLLAVLLIFTTAQLQAQVPDKGNEPMKDASLTRVEEAAAVLGVYEGRCPCQQIAKQLKKDVSPDCIKLKWRLTLYQDPSTHTAGTFKFEGSFFREAPLKGTVTTHQGTPSRPGATVYELHMGNGMGSLFLQKGGEQVLFILDENKNFYVGNHDFSYTLNRVRNKPA